MAEKTVKTRIQMKHDTSTNWSKAVAFIPLEGEIIFYSDVNKIKIGDGKTLVNDLPFIKVTKEDITDFNHSHDDIYYTETEIDSLIAALSNLLDTKLDSFSSLSAEKISGNFNTGLTPSATNTFNIGSETNRWKDLYLDGSLIYEDKVNISADGVLLKNGATLTDGTNTLTVEEIAKHNHDDRYYTEAEIDSKIANFTHTITANAEDDDVVVLTGTQGANAVTYKATHANSGVDAGTYKSVTVDSKGHIIAGTNPTTLAEFGIVDAYTQAQIDSELAKKLPNETKYAGSSSVGGSATSAVKLDTTTAGSATQPVYFTEGKPVATTYSLAKSVPADAKFTDTTYESATSSKAGLMSATDKSNLDMIVNSFTSDDANTTVDTIKEVLKAFENAPEGTNIVNALAGKADNVEATQEVAGLMSAEDKKFLETIVIPSYGDKWYNANEGTGSHAEGNWTRSYGDYSHAEGDDVQANGYASHGEGSGTDANADYSHAEGRGTGTWGDYSHAEGDGTRAEGVGSHAEGYWTTASGDSSHAEGSNTTASGNYSHAGGYETVAGYDYQTVVGQYNANKENTLFEVGNGEYSYSDGRIESNALEVLKDGRVKVYGAPTEDEDVVRKGDLATVATTGSYTDLDFGSISANYVLAAPDISAGTPRFRKLVAADIPSLNATKITAGTLGTSRIPNLASNKITSLSGYSKPSTTSAITTSNSLNDALGKLEAGLDTKVALDANNNLLLASNTEYPFFNLTVSSTTLGNSRTLRFSAYAFGSPQMEYHPDCPGPEITVQMPTSIQNINVNNFFAVGQKITYVDANGNTQSTTVAIVNSAASSSVELSDPILEVGLVLTFYLLPLKCNALNVLTVGQDSKANYNYQAVVGQFNNNKSNTLFEVGNGTDIENRSNAFEVLADGRAKVYGIPTEDNDVVRKQDLASKIANLTASDIPSLATSKITSGTFADERIASAATWNAKYNKPAAGIPASDLVNLASSKITSMTGYSKSSTVSAITTSDSLNKAIGKLEAALDKKLAKTEYITAGASNPSNDVGLNATAEGKSVTALGDYSHAEGYNTDAFGKYSHVEGYMSLANGDHSHAEGRSAYAVGDCSHAEGKYVTAYGDYSHAEGYGEFQASSITFSCTANSKEIIIASSSADKMRYVKVGGTVFYKTSNGNVAPVTSKITAISAVQSDGTYKITISKAISTVDVTNKTCNIYSYGASGNFSHAEGSYTIALGTASHVEGNYTTASGDSSHAEGLYTKASGTASHAEGGYTTASGYASHASGANTIAGSAYQFVIGQYNSNSSSNAFEIGWGTASAPKNILAVNTSGRVTATAFNNTSDRRLKENIKEYTPQKSILDLPVVEFDLKDTDVHQIGCIAQDLQEICPEIVNADDNGYLSITESKLTYLLLLELKRLNSEVIELKQKLNENK